MKDLRNAINSQSPTGLLMIFCATVLLMSTGGCGDDTNRQVAQAKTEQELKDRQKYLEDRLKSVEARKAQSVTVTQSPSAGSTSQSSNSGGGSGSARTFHSPSGNIACSVTGSSATCAVSKSGESFVLPSGQAARVASGVQIGRGSGESLGWGATVSVGSITCRIPPENEPSGITCRDSSTGHGFEASSASGRKKTY